MKVVILIISTRTGEYENLFRVVNQTWVKEFSNICDIYHLIGENDEDEIQENIFYSQSKEGVENVGYKMINAFERLRNKYDFIVRTNLSSYINVRSLINWLYTLPRDNFWSGFGVKHFSSGAFYIITNDLVNLIVENKESWNHEKLDDVALSEFLYYNLGIECNFIDRIDFYNSEIFHNTEYNKSIPIDLDEIDKEHIHYRFCSKDLNRLVDCENMIRLNKKIINEK